MKQRVIIELQGKSVSKLTHIRVLTQIKNPLLGGGRKKLTSDQTGEETREQCLVSFCLNKEHLGCSPNLLEPDIENDRQGRGAER
jgi:hypothetical protein